MRGITRSLRRQTLRLVPLAGLAAVLTAGTAVPQEGGGTLLTFGIDQRFSWDDNPDLQVSSTGDSFRADTRLSFGVVSETARDRLAFNLGTLLRGEDDGSGFGIGMESPSVDLSYTRSGISSSLTVSGFLREADLGDGVSLIEGAEGELPILVFEDGTARTKGARLNLSWGDSAPLGGTLRAGLTNTDYRGTTDPDLVDNRTLTFGAGLRFTLNEVTEATVDIDHRRFDEDGPAVAEDSTTISAGLSRALPRGSLRAKISSTRDEDGTRSSLSFGHSFELPQGLLSIDLGLTEAAAGGTDMTGALAWKQDLPRGGLTARLSRAVTSDTDNDETLLTALSLGWNHALTPRMGLNMEASWAKVEETSSGLVTDTASLNASVSYGLTEDWAMTFGASHRLKDEDGVGKATSNAVFLSLGRTFEWRP